MDKELFHNLQGRSIYFRKLSIDDAESMHAYVSDEDVSRFIGWPLTQSIDQTKEYLEKLISRDDEGTHLYASIIQKETESHIGSVMIFNFDKEANHAEIGYVLHKSYWGQGIVSEATSMMVDYCFKSLKLNKLHATIVDANIGSSKVVLKNGFDLEGRIREYYNIDGEIYDKLMFGKLKDKEK